MNFILTSIGIGLLVWWVMTHYKEGLDSTPMDVVQSQQGEIESIRDKLSKLTINETVIKDLQDSADTVTDQINTLQANMPDPQVKKYAQE
jgi:hypothetical protein